MQCYPLQVELKQISEISGYPFQIHYSDTSFELFRIAANYCFEIYIANFYAY